MNRVNPKRCDTGAAFEVRTKKKLTCSGLLPVRTMTSINKSLSRRVAIALRKHASLPPSGISKVASSTPNQYESSISVVQPSVDWSPLVHQISLLVPTILDSRSRHGDSSARTQSVYKSD